MKKWVTSEEQDVVLHQKQKRLGGFWWVGQDNTVSLFLLAGHFLVPFHWVAATTYRVLAATSTPSGCMSCDSLKNRHRHRHRHPPKSPPPGPPPSPPPPVNVACGGNHHNHHNKEKHNATNHRITLALRSPVVEVATGAIPIPIRSSVVAPRAIQLPLPIHLHVGRMKRQRKTVFFVTFDIGVIQYGTLGCSEMIHEMSRRNDIAILEDTKDILDDKGRIGCFLARKDHRFGNFLPSQGVGGQLKFLWHGGEVLWQGQKGLGIDIVLANNQGNTEGNFVGFVGSRWWYLER